MQTMGIQQLLKSTTAVCFGFTGSVFPPICHAWFMPVSLNVRFYLFIFSAITVHLESICASAVETSSTIIINVACIEDILLNAPSSQSESWFKGYNLSCFTNIQSSQVHLSTLEVAKT